MIGTDKFILDACCGGRMMWFDKQHPNAVYIDIRREDKGFIAAAPGYEVNPDMVMDFRDMTFPDKSFKLIAWDIPHLLSNRAGRNGIFRKKFGVLNAETWQSDLKRGFDECWRVLEDYGVLMMKWNDKNISSNKVLQLLPQRPLFGNMSSGSSHKNASKTYWYCFMKIPT